MIFTDLSAGDAVFVDANTLVYRFSPGAAAAGPQSANAKVYRTDFRRTTG